jgi:hypothetical protein
MRGEARPVRIEDLITRLEKRDPDAGGGIGCMMDMHIFETSGSARGITDGVNVGVIRRTGGVSVTIVTVGLREG